MSHPVFVLLFAALISLAIVLTGKQSWRERAHHGVWIFFLSLAATVAGSWAMYLIHG